MREELVGYTPCSDDVQKLYELTVKTHQDSNRAAGHDRISNYHFDDATRY